jgi:hypothetical protein
MAHIKSLTCVTLGQKWMPKLDIYSANALGPLLLPAVRGGHISLGVNTPSRSGNVYIANGQTDRILVPYCDIATVYFQLNKKPNCLKNVGSDQVADVKKLIKIQLVFIGFLVAIQSITL